jgi:hypothetical protein
MAELEQTTPTEPEPVVEQTTADDAEENYSNALQENIAKRGNNAYYYAHGHRNNAPAWDGDAARSPRPLRARAARSSTARARGRARPRVDDGLDDVVGLAAEDGAQPFDHGVEGLGRRPAAVAGAEHRRGERVERLRVVRVAVPDLGSKRVIQRRFNLSVPRARVPEKAPTRRDRSER